MTTEAAMKPESWWGGGDGGGYKRPEQRLSRAGRCASPGSFCRALDRRASPWAAPLEAFAPEQQGREYI